MKRDMELVRQILTEVEEYQGEVGDAFGLKIDGHSDEEVTHHLRILDEAGFIRAQFLDSLGGTEVAISRLTWSGHEFLDAARSNKVWEGAKAYALKTTGALTVESIKLAIPHVMKMLMGA